MLPSLMSLLLELESRDVKYREEAKKFLNKLISWMAANRGGYYEALQATSNPRYEGSLYLPSAKVASICGPQYSDLMIFFCLRDQLADATGAAYTRTADNTKGAIILPIYSRDEPLLNSLRKLKQSNESIFVHEFIHHLDAKRWKGTGPHNFVANLMKHGSEPGTAASEKDPSKYFNDSKEFNAYYQQAVSSYVAQFKRENKKEGSTILPVISPLNKDASKFVKILKKYYFHEGFIGHLSPRLMRHLDKRLANLYVHLKEKLSK